MFAACVDFLSRLSHIPARHRHGQRHDVGNVKPSGAGRIKSQNPCYVKHKRHLAV